MTGALTVLFALAFFGCILVSIALHEIGHLLPAKAFGVRVPKYFVGFGATAWSITRGETEYGLKWIPLGGFVRLMGMYPPPGRVGRGRLARLAEAARAYEWSEITPHDVANGRLFYQKPTWQKLVVMAGGPAMNLLIAFGLFWAIIGGYGTWQPQPVVAEVQQCIIRENQPADTPCPVPDTPAAKADIRPGDRVVEFNGVAISSYPQLVELIRANLVGPARLVVERGGVRVSLAPVNTVVSGVPDNLDPSRRIAAGWLGITPTALLVKGGPVEVVGQMWQLTQQSAVAISQFPAKVYYVLADLVQGKPRDIYGPLSILGASRVAGEVAANTGLGAAEKWVLFGSLLAAVNLFLALFNFVPLPPLDGGHIAGALWEAARRRVAQLAGRPDPGPFDTAKLLPAAYAVGGFLLLSGVVLILADIISPMQLF